MNILHHDNNDNRNGITRAETNNVVVFPFYYPQIMKSNNSYKFTTQQLDQLLIKLQEIHNEVIRNYDNPDWQWVKDKLLEVKQLKR